jgi:hypothetical protein
LGHWSFRKELKSPIIRWTGFAVCLLNLYFGDPGIMFHHMQTTVT